MQRRPSLSSLLSTSGYASSSYGGAGPLQESPSTNGTPRLTNLRLAAVNSTRTGWQAQNNTASQSDAPAVASDPGPWVEQQQQQSTLTTLETDEKHDSVNGSPTPANSSINASVSGDLDDDELIPTAIVIKNIPFAIKKEQLLDVMTKLTLPLPYAFNYHFDNGVFRGLAFANFTLTDETLLVVNQLNGREIGGRKLRVEYKKMLPLQERERIEREKREKRGQLEEQHRLNSNALLASLLSAASTTAATKNLSINGSNQNGNPTERVFINFPFNGIQPPLELDLNDLETLELYTQLVLYRDDVNKSIFELAISPASMNLSQRKTLSVLCAYLGLLELFDNGLIIIRRKPGYVSLSIIQQPSALNPQTPSQSQSQPAAQALGGVPFLAHSTLMMNLNQLAQLNNTGHPELLRLHSQSALPLPRLRQQASTPILLHFPQYQQGQQQPQQQVPVPPVQQPPSSAQSGQAGRQSQYGPQPFLYQQTTSGSGTATNSQASAMAATSAASLLRSSNRSYVDMRSTPPLGSSQYQPLPGSVTNSPTPQHQTHHGQYPGGQLSLQQHFFQTSQPSTPMTNTDFNSRFQPFGQHAHLSGSLTSLQQTTGTPPAGNTGANDEYGGKDRLSQKFNNLNLTGGTFDSGNGGIWGPK